MKRCHLRITTTRQGSRVWLEELVELKAPLLFDIRMDPFEKALETNTYYDWYTNRIFPIARAASYVLPFIQSFKKYPPSQTPATWSLGNLMEQFEPQAQD